MQTVLGTFDDPRTAQTAVDQLLTKGFRRSSVHLQSAAQSDNPSTTSASNTGVMASVGNFFSRLFESDDKTHAGTYSEAVRRGSTVVAVDANSDAEVATAQSLMRELGSVNIDDRAAQWKNQGWRGFDPDAQPVSEGKLASERESAPVIQEDLVVGKRNVDMGGLRVVKRVSETPVSEIINLRQERATIHRIPADRAASEADFENFKEGTFEVRETAEEAVVGKTARVVEEVSIGKEVTNRSEEVSDTVRRADVDVERVPGTQTEFDAEGSEQRRRN